MRIFIRLLSVLAGIGLAGPAFAQHDGPTPGGQGAARGQDVNIISITPVSPLQAVPVVQVDTMALPDVGPDRMLERYIDGVMSGQIAAGRIPGAAVVIVRNGEVVLKKGYGFADLEKKTPIDPDATRFRVASISKLFTALAAMQEVDGGRLDLEADVNRYLKDFKLTPFGAAPITVGSLLDHTSGFDDKYLGMAAAIGAPRQALDAYLAENVPRAVLPVGKVFNYSNYGYGMAGHLASQASGLEFRALMAQRFFAPLQMRQSSFGIPEPVPSQMATPYNPTPTGLSRARYDQILNYPAGDLVTTADDLSRFMLALVKQGGGVVKPVTLKAMLAPRIVPGKTGDSWGLGFALGENNGVNWFGHGGAWPGYAAELRMNEESRSGFLVLMNVDNRFDIIQPIVNALTDALWPAPPDATQPDIEKAKIAAAALQGTFMAVRRARGDFTKLGAGLTSFRLTHEGDGRLAGTTGGLPLKLLFEPERDGVWRERTFRWRLSAFDGAGGASREGVLLGPFAFERVGFAHDLLRQVPFLGAAATVFAVLLAAWGAGAFSRRMFGEPMAAVPLVPRILGASSMALGLAFLSGFGGAMAGLKDQDVLSGSLGALPVLLVLPLALVPTALGVAYFAVRGFGPGLRHRLAQATFSLLTVLLGFVLWFAWTWNLHIFAR